MGVSPGGISHDSALSIGYRRNKGLINDGFYRHRTFTYTVGLGSLARLFFKYRVGTYMGASQMPFISASRFPTSCSVCTIAYMAFFQICSVEMKQNKRKHTTAILRLHK